MILKRTKRLRIRLSAKITILVTLFLAAAFTVITPIIITTVTRQAKQTLVNQAKSYTTLATKPIGDFFLRYRDSGTDLLRERIESTADLYVGITNIYIVDVTGSELYAMRPDANNINKEQAETFEPIYEYGADGFLNRIIYPLIEESKAHRYTVVYDISSIELKTVLESLKSRIIYIALVILFICIIVFTILLEFALVRPLNYMSTMALAIKAGEFDREIKLKRKDEIGDLGDSINAMAKTLKENIVKLSEAEKLKSEFLIISSHNLRTPLTVINGYIDLLNDTQLDETTKGYVAQIETKATELTELTNDMLTIAELEVSGQPRLQLQDVDVALLIKNMEEEATKRCSDKDIKLNVQVPTEQLLIKSQPTYIQTALWNLLDNAIKFTPKNGTISLSLTNQTENVQLIVKDSGAGISPEELPKLFTKFHRGTSIMEYQYSGVGLGLYMTKLMLDLLGGTITAKSELGKGSKFIITLPKS